MADYGIKITKTGFDTATAAVKDQVFNSTYNSFKIIASGQITISVLATDTGIKYASNINHGLSYIPGFLAFAQLRGSSTVSYSVNGLDLFSGSGEGFYGDANTTRLRLGVDAYGTAYTATIYYYIFADPGS